MQEGLLQAGICRSGSWHWQRRSVRGRKGSSVDYEVNTPADPPWVRLSYTLTATGEDLDYRVGLTTTAPHFGGLRWWFVCPLTVNGVPCGRRVGKLYLPGQYFGCRHCHELTYTSCQESHRYDRLWERIARDTGQDVREVKRIMQRLGKRSW
jgi:hypothetical protein